MAAIKSKGVEYRSLLRSDEKKRVYSNLLIVKNNIQKLNLKFSPYITAKLAYSRALSQEIKLTNDIRSHKD